jgi:hypothetical protein
MLGGALAALALGLGAFTLMAVKDRNYVPSAPYAPRGKPNRAGAVVYYSRSGHTEAVAREIARAFNAPIARIDADYPRDFAGQSKAVADANAHALPEIRVEPIDLVPARGGCLSRHIFLRRGRIFWQKSREELLQEVRAEIDAARSSTCGTGDVKGT